MTQTAARPQPAATADAASAAGASGSTDTADTAAPAGPVPPRVLPLTAAPHPARALAPARAAAGHGHDALVPRAPQAPPATHRPHAPRPPRHPRTACAPGRGGAADLAARFALRLAEVLTGARPAGQLTRHTTHDGYRQLTRLVHGGPLRARGGAGRPRLGPVHDFSPAPNALEVCVRVESGARHHMMAFRLERHHVTDQWQCAAVETR